MTEENDVRLAVAKYLESQGWSDKIVMITYGWEHSDFQEGGKFAWKKPCPTCGGKELLPPATRETRRSIAKARKDE